MQQWIQVKVHWKRAVGGMAVENIWDSRRQEQVIDVAAVATRPRLGAVDLLLQLWRAKALMFLVAVVVFLPFLLLAFTMPTKYESTSGLIVSLGEESVYRPRVGSEAAGAIPDQELLNQAELELLRSPAVVERVIDAFSLERIYPEIASERAFIAAEKPGRDPMEKMRQMAVKTVLEDFSVGAAPNSNVIRASFKHQDAEVSATLLNALVDSYLQYRSEVYSSSRSSSFGEQRARFENELASAEAAIQNFLAANRIDDFDAERDAAQKLYASVSDEVFKVSARASAVDGQLLTLARQMRQTDPLVDIFVEDSTEQTLLNLHIEREQALSRYKPDSRIVESIDKQIAQVEAYLGNKQGSIGTRRTGPNPVFQDMEQRRANLEAEATSLKNQKSELLRQKASASERLRTFELIRPEWQELRRRRDLVARNLSSFAEREIESQTLTEIAKQEADNIRVIERARPPLTGTSLKVPIAALGLAFALFTALIAGLVRATTRAGFSTAGSVERTTGLPVIASVRKR